MASGWTGELIAPNMRVHDAAHAAIDHVGNKDMMQATANPAHPEHAAILGNVLRDPTLGSRTVFHSNVPAGVPVGSASVAQAGSAPAAVQQAILNLGQNTQTNSLMQILNRVLGGFSQAPVAAAAPNSPAQEDYFRSQTALNTTRNNILLAPGQIQNQINTVQNQNPPSLGIMSLAPALPGQYNPANDNALQSLYGQQADAKRMSTSGWTAPTY